MESVVKMSPMWQHLVLASLFLVSVHSSYHHGKDSDYYGEYYYDAYGRKVYAYCYEKGFSTRDDCRSRKQYRYSSYTTEERKTYYSASNFLTSPSYSNAYHHYDGRGNVNVGHGRFYRRGRDVIVDCEFPSNNRHISNVIWYRKSHGDNYRSPYDDQFYHRQNRHRYYVETWGEHGSRLVIKDYRPIEDDGIYRCFATRYRSGHYGGGREKESIYMEVDVYSSQNWIWD